MVFFLPSIVGILSISIPAAIAGKSAMSKAMRITGREAIIILILNLLCPPLWFIEMLFFMPLVAVRLLFDAWKSYRQRNNAKGPNPFRLLLGGLGIFIGVTLFLVSMIIYLGLTFAPA